MAVGSLVPGAVVTTGNDMDAIYNCNIMEIQTIKSSTYPWLWCYWFLVRTDNDMDVCNIIKLQIQS